MWRHGDVINAKNDVTVTSRFLLVISKDPIYIYIGSGYIRLNEIAK